MDKFKKALSDIAKSWKLSTETIAVLIGFTITIVFSITYLKFVDYTKQFENMRKPSPVFNFLQDMANRYNDTKYKIRGASTTEAPVALVAIDEDSLREVGRWPWSRDIISQLISNSLKDGAKVVGFDVIFSEPEKLAPQNDVLLKDTVEKNSNKVILGTQSDNQAKFAPYQDYCVTQAFLKTGGVDIVKLNPTFVVNEDPGIYSDLHWDKLFDMIFTSEDADVQTHILKELNRLTPEDLTPFQKNYLASEQAKNKFDFCEKWGTEEDGYLSNKDPDYRKKLGSLYEEVFSTEKSLSGVSWEEAFQRAKSETLAHPVPEYGQWTPNIPEIQKVAPYTASFVAQVDQDGPVRRYPLFFRSGNRLGSSFIPSLALQSYLLSTGYRADVEIGRVNPNVPKKEITSFKIVDPSKEPEQTVMELPVDSRGQLLINYYGGQNTLPYVSAREILNSSEEITVFRQVPLEGSSQLRILKEKRKKSEFLKGRALLVGASALALYDLRSTPLEANYPGPELHLTVLANLFDKNFIKTNPNEKIIVLLAMVVIGLLSSVVWSYAGALSSIGFFILIFAAALVADFYYFISQSVLTTGVFVQILIAVIYLTLTAVRYFFEEQKKKEIKSTFSKYVSPKVVDELLSSAENLKLGGHKQTMTVFFSDVRGFTTISEKLSPEELSNVLNRYLTPMTELVFKNNGTLDKYMGDAIMAFFGAPIPTPYHAKYACQCALDNMVKLKEIQAEFEKEGLPFIDIGIGINTGEMSVGNMGSNIVQNYTVMGDSVNLGSRLEGINKTYGTKIIISEFTQKDIGDAFVTREIDRVQVKGKNEPVRIYELIAAGRPDENMQQWITEFERGYGLYMTKHFQDAIYCFEAAIKLRQGDPVSELYVERCNDFIAEPPPPDWDGVYVSKTK